VRETIQVEIDGDSQAITIINTKSYSSKTTTTKRATPPPKDPRVVAAEKWLADYRACKPQVRAAPSAIRAYRIWYTSADLPPQELAKILRQPPLQTNTVVGYILDAIRLERVPFDRARLRDEVLALVPEDVRVWRYKSLLQLVERKETTSMASVKDGEPPA
jgi:hypothetical protein